MESLYADWRCKPIVDAVMGFKGFQMIAAMMMVSEVGDFVRFHPYVNGLAPLMGSAPSAVG
jgi:hypothetical protein